MISGTPLGQPFYIYNLGRPPGQPAQLRWSSKELKHYQIMNNCLNTCKCAILIIHGRLQIIQVKRNDE